MRCSIVLLYCFSMIGCSKEQENVPKAFLTKNTVEDLGNHMVAYLTEAALGNEEEREWIVIQDLDSKDNLYIPNDLGEILEIKVLEKEIYIKFKQDEKEMQEINIPILFPYEGRDVWNMVSYSLDEKVVKPLEAIMQPAIVWEEKIKQDEEEYYITFERISLPYYGAFEYLADYILVIKDTNGNILWSKIIREAIAFEEVYWLKDISQDGFLDIIFCTNGSSQNREGELWTLIWNNQKKMYEFKDFPDGQYFKLPQWNEKLSTFMFFEDGYNDYVSNMKMYMFRNENWELYADVITHSEEEDKTIVFKDRFEEESYFKELDYYQTETFYEQGEAVKKMVVDAAPWWDENSIWYRDNGNNLRLYPEKDTWEEIEEQISLSESLLKYVRRE